MNLQYFSDESQMKFRIGVYATYANGFHIFCFKYQIFNLIQ